MLFVVQGSHTALLGMPDRKSGYINNKLWHKRHTVSMRSEQRQKNEADNPKEHFKQKVGNLRAVQTRFRMLMY